MRDRVGLNEHPIARPKDRWPGNGPIYMCIVWPSPWMGDGCGRGTLSPSLTPPLLPITPPITPHAALIDSSGAPTSPSIWVWLPHYHAISISFWTGFLLGNKSSPTAGARVEFGVGVMVG